MLQVFAEAAIDSLGPVGQRLVIAAWYGHPADAGLGGVGLVEHYPVGIALAPDGGFASGRRMRQGRAEHTIRAVDVGCLEVMDAIKTGAVDIGFVAFCGGLDKKRRRSPELGGGVDDGAHSIKVRRATPEVGPQHAGTSTGRLGHVSWVTAARRRHPVSFQPRTGGMGDGHLVSHSSALGQFGIDEGIVEIKQRADVVHHVRARCELGRPPRYSVIHALVEHLDGLLTAGTITTILRQGLGAPQLVRKVKVEWDEKA